MANQETNQEAASASSPPLLPDSPSIIHLMLLLMTNEDEARFTEIISRPDLEAIQRIASMMTVRPFAFAGIIRNKTGTERVQKLLGISPEADVFFYHAILSCFVDIMTETYSYNTVKRAMEVFDQEKRQTLSGLIYKHSLVIACTEYGYAVLGQIITNEEDHQFKNRLLDVVARHALFLSNHVNGNFLVQRVLELNDLRTTHNISVMLRGHYINLSCNKHGSFVVEKILDATTVVVQTIHRVVEEFLMCDEDTLVMVASDRYGKFVVAKALEVTHVKMHPALLFSSLIRRLMPLRHLFGRSSPIAEVLDSTVPYDYSGLI